MKNVQQILQRASAKGSPPADLSVPDTAERPWPVVLLTALGAWLAALPLLLFLWSMFREFLESIPGPYVAAALLLAVGTLTLRQRRLPVFVEQLAMPLLSAGLALLGLGLFRHGSGQTPQTQLALAALVLAIALPRHWLRTLLGAFVGGLIVTLALNGKVPPDNWTTCHATLAVWLVALGSQSRLPCRAAAALESIAAGWLVAVLAALALFSGMTFLMGGLMGAGAFGHEQLHEGGTGAMSIAALLQRSGSVLLALAGTLYAAYRWPGLRRPLCGCVAVVLVTLCAWLPMLAVRCWRLPSPAPRDAGGRPLLPRWRPSGSSAVSITNCNGRWQ